MKLRLSILAGLLAGVAAAALLFGGIVALAPLSPGPSRTIPSFAVSSLRPSADPSIGASVPSDSPAASGSAPGATVTP